jgi:signal transduction histidine kinase
MRYSRLRLRLAGWFALGMLLGLAVLDVSLFILLRRRADARLDAQVLAAAEGLVAAVSREAAEVPAPPLAQAVHDALDEWPAGPAALSVFGSDGSLLGQRGAPALVGVLGDGSRRPKAGRVVDLSLNAEGEARLATAAGSDRGGFVVVAAQSTAPLTEDLETLAWWLGLSVPLVLLVSLPAGYLLARRALAPFHSLAQQLEGMSPGALGQRLPVSEPPDELDRLADQVNRLLDRLADSQRQTRRFLAQAAHQLRTPLSLIRGESDLAIGQSRPADDYCAALDRISRASAQMSRRVDELFLLARAEAGEQVPRTAVVELDAVALEAADLMRGRAQGLGHRLELGEMAGIEVLGDEGLLREAVLELLENACRHGSARAPIVLAVRRERGEALLEVSSAGSPGLTASEEEGGERLGLAIVRWIATAHGGTLLHSHDGSTNRFGVALPAAQAVTD